MSALTIDGELVHYEVLGRGRPVLLVHGMLGSWRYWIPTIQALQQSFRVYALDLYGFGDSARVQDRYRLAGQVGLIAAFMEEMGLPKIAMVGHDLGGLVATAFAMRYPQRVARLMAVSLPLADPGDLETRVPAPPDSRPEPPPAAPAVPPAAAAMQKALQEAASTRSLPRPGSAATPVPPAPAAPSEPARRTEVLPTNPLKEMLSGGLEPLLARCFRRGEPSYEKLAVDIARTDLRAPAALIASYQAGLLLDSLRLLAMPLVVLHGHDDPIHPPPSEAVLHYLTADAAHAVVPMLYPGVRHFPMLEDSRFGALVKECLEAPDITRVAVRERWVRRNR